MAKAAILWLAMALSGAPVMAQMPGLDRTDSPWSVQQVPHEPSALKLLNRFSKDLKLTEDEKRRIKPLLDTEREQFEALRSGSPVREEWTQKMQAIEVNSWAAIRLLLTASQQKKFDALTTKMAGKRELAATREDADQDVFPPDGPPPGSPPPQ